MRKSLFYKISIVALLSLSGLIIVLAIYAILQKYTHLAEINLLKITQLLQQLFVFGIPAIIGVRFLNKNNGISNTPKKGYLEPTVIEMVTVAQNPQPTTGAHHENHDRRKRHCRTGRRHL